MKSTVAFLFLAFVIANVTSQSTTPKPTPPPSYVVLSVNDGNVTCILLNITANFNFQYLDDSNSSKTYNMPLPSSATATGKCDKTQMIVIEFGKNSDKLTFVFGKDDSSTYIENVTLAFTMDSSFPGINTTKKAMASTSKDQFFKGSSGSPYICKSNQTMELKGDANVTLSTIDTEVEAFRKSNTTNFGDNAVNCPADAMTSNIVPIAVGAALAALVVIVLIAYLISRNRNKRGYESV